MNLIFSCVAIFIYLESCSLKFTNGVCHKTTINSTKGHDQYGTKFALTGNYSFTDNEWCLDKGTELTVDMELPEKKSIEKIFYAVKKLSNPMTINMVFEYRIQGGCKYRTLQFGSVQDLPVSLWQSAESYILLNIANVEEFRFTLKKLSNDLCLTLEIEVCDVNNLKLCPSGCKNGATCFRQNKCLCRPAFTGSQCETSFVPDGACVHPLGMVNGKINSSQLVVSSSRPSSKAEFARLGSCKGWCPALNDTQPWYQVEFPQRMGITGIVMAIQSRNQHHPVSINTIRVSYKEIGDDGKMRHLLDFNASTSVAYYPITSVTPTAALRIEIPDTNSSSCFQFEIYGCAPKEIFPDKISYSFLKIVDGHTLETNSSRAFVFGKPTLLSGLQGKALYLNGRKQFVNFEPVNDCLVNPSSCRTDVAFSVWLNFEKLEDNTYIFTNGGDLPAYTGISFYWRSNRFYFLVSSSFAVCMSTIDEIPNLFTWNLYLFVWNAKHGGEVYVNNRKLSSHPVCERWAYAVNIQQRNLIWGYNAYSVGGTLTYAQMLIEDFTVYFESKLILGLIGVVNNPCPKGCLNGGTCIGSNNCSCLSGFVGEMCQTTAKTVKELDIKLENSSLLTIHGGIKIQINSIGSYVIFSKHSEFLEVQTRNMPCFSDLSHCFQGFTFRLDLNFNKFVENSTVLSSRGETDNCQGFSIHYLDGKLHVVVCTGFQIWSVSLPAVERNIWQHFEISWSGTFGLCVYINKLLAAKTTNAVLQETHAAKTVSIWIGRSHLSQTTFIGLAVANLKTWFTTRHILVTLNQVTERVVASHNLVFLGIAGNKVITPAFNLTLIGQPETRVYENGLIYILLNGNNQCINVGNHFDGCFGQPISCSSGFTIALGLNVRRWKEGIYILATAGISKQGVFLYYHQSKLVVSVRTRSKSWTLLLTEHPVANSWHKYEISWNQERGLFLYIDGNLFNNIQFTNNNRTLDAGTGLLIGCSPDQSVKAEIWVNSIKYWQAIRQEIGIVGKSSEIPLPPVRMTFLKIIGSTLVTTTFNATLTGNVKLVKGFKGQALYLKGGSVSLGLPKNICPYNVSDCKSGFTISIGINFEITDKKQKTYIFSNGGDLKNSSGIAIYYLSEKIYFVVSSLKRVWIAKTVNYLNIHTWHRYSFIFSMEKGPLIYIDGKLAKTSMEVNERNDTVTIRYKLYIGTGPTTQVNHRAVFLVEEFKVFKMTHDKLVVTGLIDVHCPNGCFNGGKCLQSGLCLCLNGYVGTRCEISKRTVVTTSLNMTIIEVTEHEVKTSGVHIIKHGQVDLGKFMNFTFLNLRGENTYLEVNTTQAQCFWSLTHCFHGFTLKLDISFEKLVDKTFILSSGGEAKGTQGFSFYYKDKKLHVVVRTHLQQWLVTLPGIAAKNSWHNYEFTWSPITGLYVYVDNIFVSKTVKATEQMQATIICPNLWIGKSPSNKINVSLGFKIANLHTWFTTRHTLITIGAVTEKKLVFHELTFLKVEKNMLISRQFNLTIHGNVKVCKFTTNQIFVKLTGSNQYIDVGSQLNGCLGNLTLCSSGFTLEVGINIQKWINNTYILSNGGETKHSQGIVVWYMNGKLMVQVRSLTKLWTAILDKLPLTRMWHQLQISWKETAGIFISLNGKIQTLKTKHKMISAQSMKTYSLMLGRSVLTTTQVDLWISNVRVWLSSHTQLTALGLRKDITLPPVMYNFLQIDKDILVTSAINGTLYGGPVLIVGRFGQALYLNGKNQYVDFGKLEIPCLMNLDNCHSGFSFNVHLNFEKLLTNTYIFSNGGGLEKSSGISLFYENGSLYFVVSTSSQVWKLKLTYTFELYVWYHFQFHWHHESGLEIFVNGFLVGKNSVAQRWSGSSVHSKNLCFGFLQSNQSTVAVQYAKILIEGFSIWSTKRTLRVISGVIQDYCNGGCLNGGTCKGNKGCTCLQGFAGMRCEVYKKSITDLSLKFINSSKNVLITEDLNITSHGQVILNISAQRNYVVLERVEQFLHIPTKAQCLQELQHCFQGFTLSFEISFLALTENTTILSSRGTSNKEQGLLICFKNKQLHVLLRSRYQLWQTTLPGIPTTDTWHTFEISWKPDIGLFVFVDNFLVACGSHSLQQEAPITASLFIGKPPSSSIQTVSHFRFANLKISFTARQILLQLNQVVETKVLFRNFTFLRSENQYILTPSYKLTRHKNASVTDGVLSLRSKGQYVDFGLQLPTCLSNLEKCMSGFTLGLQLNVKKWISGMSILSNGDLNVTQGLTIKYALDKLLVMVGTTKKIWTVKFEKAEVNTWNFYVISWSEHSGLKVYVNRQLIGYELIGSIRPHSVTTTYNVLCLGRSPKTITDIDILMRQIYLWTATKEILIIFGKTTDTKLFSTTVKPSSALITTSPSGTLPGVFKVFKWEFTSITNSTIIGSSFNITLVGGLPLKEGVFLNHSTQYIDLGKSELSCLRDLMQCQSGLTLSFKIKLFSVEETMYLISTGGEKPYTAGMVVLYRFGQLQVVFSSNTTIWYASIHEVMLHKWLNIHVSWHHSRGLLIYVNGHITGLSRGSVSHEGNNSKIYNIFIGCPSTQASYRSLHMIIQSFTVWYTYIEVLVIKGLINITNIETTTKPTRSSMSATLHTHSTPPTTIKTSEAISPPKMTSPTVTKTGQCPAGCVSIATTTAVSSKPKITTTIPSVVPTYKGCPELKVSLTTNGKWYFACLVMKPPPEDVELIMTWYIEKTVVYIEKLKHKILESKLFTSELTNYRDIYSKKIHCTVKAGFIGRKTNYTTPSGSNIIDTTVKLVTKELVLVEGQVEKFILVNVTIPPALFCVSGEECVVEIVVKQKNVRERKCSQTTVIPQIVLGRETTSATQLESLCGTFIRPSTWQTLIKISVKATVDGIIDHNVIKYLQVSLVIHNINIMHKIGIVKVQVIDKDRRAICGSVNDPHMTTFDRLHYNNFLSGEFLLYKHKTLPYEVRARYAKCGRTATCNTGVAVRSGDDVIVFGTITKKSGWFHKKTSVTVKIYKNAEWTAGTMIKRFGCGQKYQVIFPTGTIVTVQASYRPFLNIWVAPSVVDFNNTEGLCGLYDGSRRNDLTHRNGQIHPISSRPDAFSLSWKEGRTMFYGVDRLPKTESSTYCSCVDGFEVYCSAGLDVFHCETKQVGDVTESLLKQARMPQIPSNKVRHKRTAHLEDGNLSELNVAPTGWQLNDTSWNETSAKDFCENYLSQSNVTRACGAVLNQNFTVERKNCAEDILQTGDTDFAEATLESIIEDCIATASKLSSPNSTYPLSFVEDGLCLQNCGQHGYCVRGQCSCDEGYAGDNCSVSKDTVPSVMQLDDEQSICDNRTEDTCQFIPIFGNNFVNSSFLTCHYEMIHVGDKISKAGKKLSAEGIYISMTQVLCQHVTGSAWIRVSNNRKLKSTIQVLYVIYDSICHNCEVYSNTARCQKKRGVCYINGNCFKDNTISSGDPCKICDSKRSQSSWSVSNTPKCTEKFVEVKKSDLLPSKTDTIILGVACCLLLLLILIAVIYICHLRKNQHPNEKQLQSDIYTNL